MSGIVSSGKLGQVQIIAAVLFLLLIPTTAILAQNATNPSIVNISLEGNVIQHPQNTTEITDSNASDVTNQSPTSVLEQLPANETSETVINSSEPVEELPQSNQTNSIFNVSVVEENLTETNQTVNVTLNTTEPPDETNQTANVTNQDSNSTGLQNDTSSNQANTTETVNETGDVGNTTSDEIPEDAMTGHADISVDTGCIDALIRGEKFTLYTVLSNSGTSAALNVSPQWVLPPDFDIMESENPCSTINPGERCTVTATIYVPQSVALGPDEIRILVSYAE
jgi:hypothetical protein